MHQSGPIIEASAGPYGSREGNIFSEEFWDFLKESILPKCEKTPHRQKEAFG